MAISRRLMTVLRLKLFFQIFMPFYDILDAKGKFLYNLAARGFVLLLYFIFLDAGVIQMPLMHRNCLTGILILFYAGLVLHSFLTWMKAEQKKLRKNKSNLIKPVFDMEKRYRDLTIKIFSDVLGTAGIVVAMHYYSSLPNVTITDSVLWVFTLLIVVDSGKHIFYEYLLRNKYRTKIDRRQYERSKMVHN